MLVSGWLVSVLVDVGSVIKAHISTRLVRDSTNEFKQQAHRIKPATPTYRTKHTNQQLVPSLVPYCRVREVVFDERD